MNIQVLIAAMHQQDYSLPEKMNIQTDAIIVNQCDKDEFYEFSYLNNRIRILSLDERGVGLSRNTALMRATSDIVLFADEDMEYVNEYPSLILSEFEKTPEADVILFSLESLNNDRPLLKISKSKRISKISALKYGCARVAIRRERLISRNIWFSLLFGGGAKYGSGEDTIFLQDCLKAKLRVYLSPVKIAYVKQENSTWFQGFNEIYFFDKGVLMATIMPAMCWVYAIATAIKFMIKKPVGINCKNILKSIFDGIKHKKSL